MNDPSPKALRARRRAPRIADNRTDILDAAERVFAERGTTEGSLRDIATAAGFSTAAIYNYFDSKDHLLAETLIRRGTELLAVIDSAAAEAGTPMAKLHGIAEATVAFFAAFPDFRRLLRRARDADATLSSLLTQHAADEVDRVVRTFALMTGIVEDGQRLGEIREGAPSALTHLYMSFVYEHVFLAGENPTGALTLEQFQDMLDGAFRATGPGRRRR